MTGVQTCALPIYDDDDDDLWYYIDSVSDECRDAHVLKLGHSSQVKCHVYFLLSTIVPMSASN